MLCQVKFTQVVEKAMQQEVRLEASRNGNPLQYSCLENPWTGSQSRTDITTHTHTHGCFHWKEHEVREELVKLSGKGKGHLCRGNSKCKEHLRDSKENKVTSEE